MKSLHPVVLAIIYFNVSAICSAASDVRVELIYNWQPLKIYTYRYMDENERESPTIDEMNQDLLISVLGRTGENAILALQGLGLTNYVHFTTVDRFGHPKNTQIFSKQDLCKSDFNDMQTFREAGLARGMYNKLMWELPEVPLDVGKENKNLDGMSWLCTMRDNICVLEKSKDRNNNKETTETLFFNTSTGCLVEYVIADVANTKAVRLKSVSAMPMEKVKQLTEQHKNALTLDEFIERAFKPYTRSNVPRIQRSACYSLLKRIQNPERKYRICLELMSVSDACIDYKHFLTATVASELYSGQRWCLELLTKENLDQMGYPDLYDQGIDILKRLSSLNLGSDRTSWAIWYERIGRSLPDFGDEQSTSLVEHMADTDPWVRLFALTQLVLRSNVASEPQRYGRVSAASQSINLIPLLEKALSDEDENVRGFAESELKKLKAQAKKQEDAAK